MNLRSFLFVLLALGSMNLQGQDCLSRVANGLVIQKKDTMGQQGGQCLFIVKFCVKKNTTEAEGIEFTCTTQGGFKYTHTVNCSADPVGTEICHNFTFVTGCSATASFVAIGKDGNNDLCCTIADILLLPLRLTSFTATQSNGHSSLDNHPYALLRWQTSSEQNTSHFVIQESTNGGKWKNIGKLAAAGNSTHNVDYQFKTPAQSGSRMYYRLEIHDLDGTINYSYIVSLKRGDFKNVLKISPNPVTSVISLNIGEINPTDLEIYSIHGQRIFTFTGDRSGRIDVADLNSGVYLLRYRDNQSMFVKN